MRLRPLVLPVLVSIAGCAPIQQPPAPPEKPALTLERATFAQLPGWATGDPRPALTALDRSCHLLLSAPEDSLGLSGADWRAPCAALAQLPRIDPAVARGFVETAFTPFRMSDHGNDQGLFTGYYEAELHGSLTRTDRYKTPIYRRPDDLIEVDLGQFRPDLKSDHIAGRVEAGHLVPYPDRRAIEAGALSGRDLELLWVDDPVDAFFLEIQGSGRVILPDGSVIRVGYAGQNGRPYVAIGRVLADRGVPKEAITMAYLRDWIASHGEAGRALMDENPSFVFFRILPGDGPIGAEGLPLTPEGSAAIDPHFLPYGVPIWVETTDSFVDGGRFTGLFIAQDTGGAIRGPVRADLFFGYGPGAAAHAGGLKGHGRAWVLLPKAAADRKQSAAPAS